MGRSINITSLIKAKELVIAFGKEATQFISDKVSSESLSVSTYNRDVYNFYENGFGIDSQTNKWHSKFLIDNKFIPELAKLSSAKTAYNFLIKKNLISKPNLSNSKGQKIKSPSYTQMFHAPSNPLISLICEYFDKVSNYQFYNRKFENIYRRYEKMWLAEPKVEAMAILLGFETKSKKIIFETGVQIIGLTASRKSRLWGPLDLYTNHISINDLVASMHYLQIIRPGENVNEQELNEIIQDVLTALRLVQSGDIGTPGIFRWSLPQKPFSGRVFSPLVDYQISTTMGRANNTYILTKIQITSARKIYKQLRKIRKLSWKQINIPLRWFNRSYSRSNLFDRNTI